MPVDLNDTLVFIKVVQERSFSGAARALRLPKTTVSRRVRELETYLGTKLLTRTTRRLGLTEAGTLYFQHCGQIPDELKAAEAVICQHLAKPRGWLRVTSSYSLMTELIAPLIGEFRILYPDVFFDLILSHETLDLVSEQIDVALRMGPLAESSLAARRLGAFQNRVFASRKYLERHGEPAHPDELRHHFALATRVACRNHGFAWSMSNGGELRDYAIEPVVIADDPQVLKGPLFAGEGLMLATDMIMRKHVDDGLVQAILPGWTGRKPELNAVFPRGPIQTPKIRAFIDFMVSRIAQDALSGS